MQDYQTCIVMVCSVLVEDGRQGHYNITRERERERTFTANLHVIAVIILIWLTRQEKENDTGGMGNEDSGMECNIDCQYIRRLTDYIGDWLLQMAVTYSFGGEQQMDCLSSTLLPLR